MIRNLKDFMEARGFGEESFKDIERNTYKYTDCGAWIQEKTEDRVDYESPHIEEFNDAPTYKHHTGLTVGSIVEGVDYDCTPVTLTYPFEMDEFWKALKAVEDQATEIWKDTHGCEDCWGELQSDEHGNVREFGNWPINGTCKTCEGEGTII
jgi:hypothetical protein